MSCVILLEIQQNYTAENRTVFNISYIAAHYNIMLSIIHSEYL